jgi:hypothetical protein
MSKENDEPDFWDVLSDEDRHRQLLILGAGLVALVPLLGPRGIAIAILLSIFFSTRKPGPISFMVFFQR